LNPANETLQTSQTSQRYPNFNGPNKPLQHPDLVLLAKVAEHADIDLRIVYLRRDALDLLRSDLGRWAAGAGGYALESAVLR
jgi:hypothetical protein